jgi:predicted  nucleic acid-binding Zn-ribbon protein
MANVKEFSVEEKLTALVTLQKIESKLDEIHILKGELPMEVADLEDEIQGLHARQTRIEEEINGVTDFITQRKEAIKEAEALVKKYEKQSTNVKNNREFEAINKEIEMQQLEVKLAEKHIKDATEEIAEKAVLLEKAKKNIGSKEGLLSTKKGELEKIIAANEKEE